MGLCYVCRGIPFDNPPSLPPPYFNNLPGKPNDPGNTNLFFVESSDPNYDAPPYGYLHWQSAAELERSTQSCSLCSLIYKEFAKNTSDAPHPDGHYNFFITRREKDQSGFLVWTQGDRPLVIWRVGAFGYSVDDVSSSLAYNFRGRRIRERAKDPATQNIAKQWLDHCVNYHTLCGPPGGTSPRLPTRVLDLEASNASRIQLWETKGARNNYTTLSYVWGHNSLGDAYKTTPGNIDLYKGGIDPARDGIPQTIVDAIDITRRMGIRYLWVDALCIRQDTDFKDFNVEGLKMMDYYGNSYLTITAASSSDAYSGVFNARSPPNYTSFSHTTRSGVHGTLIVTVLDPDKENLQPYYLLFAGNPIIDRAWTLQERVLSTRNIFYADDQMYYECNEHFVSEDGLLAHGRQLSLNPNTKDLSLYDRVWPGLWKMWDLAIAEYGGREMHDPTRNKFVAICGLAKRFGQRLRGGHYLAGLWEHRLIQQLFWTTSTLLNPEAVRSVWPQDWPPAPQSYRAPSWSWACVDVPIANPDGAIYNAELYATHENSTIQTVQGDDYGQISYADLTIKAPMLHVRYLRGYILQGGSEGHEWARYDDPGGVNIATSFSTVFDYRFNRSQLDALDVYALVLGRDTTLSQDGISDIIYLCLLVTRREGGQGYRRMGIVKFDEFSMGNQAIRFVDRSNYDEILLV